MKTLNLLLTAFVLALVVFSCKKEKNMVPETTPTPYRIRMTDAPAAYSAVNIDLQSVVITGNNGNSVTLNTNAGIYNLLNFSNGLDTLIATGNLLLSKVQQIRLILGPNNSIVDGGVTYPLLTPSAQQSGLKLQVHHELQPGVAYEVLLDFDATQSIVKEGNGTYSLKPVIRTVETALSGSIKGTIVPPGVFATVTATSGGVSYSTIVNANGEFLLAGLPPGTYTLNITPVAPYTVVNLTNVVVSIGLTTDVGTLNI